MKVAILGCGWLGFPLALALQNQGHIISGTTTSFSKMELLRNAEITPFQIELFENEILGEIQTFLADLDCLIIAIPPKLRGEFKENFVQKITNLIPFIEEAAIPKVLFISSTSVYDEVPTLPVVDEDTILNPASENGKQLWQAEQLLQNNPHFKTTVLRFGGLLGPDRNPIRSLSGKTPISNPDAPVNFIYLEDCITIISKMLEPQYTTKWGSTYNAVGTQHPLRKDYYREKAIQFGLEPPLFSEKQSIGKCVSSEKVCMDFNFIFTIPIE